MESKTTHRLAILVVSCDKYSDLWDVFFDLWNRFWPDCPYQMYLGSNFREFKRDGVKTLCIGEDASWAENVSKMLDMIDEDYILNLGEDYYLARNVDEKRIEGLFQYLIKNGLDCIHLQANNTGLRILDKNLGIEYIEPGEPYYVCASPCIWNKESMRKFLIPGYTAWDFELKNSKSVQEGEQNFATVHKSVFDLRNGVIRGKYLRSTIDFLSSIGIHVDTTERGVIEDTGAKKILSAKLTKIKMCIYIKLRLYKMGFVRNKLNI